MTNKEAIEIIKIAMAEVEWDYPMDYTVAFEKAIEVLEKTSDKLCSRCVHINVCTIFDNYDIDYCSDWSEEE